MKLVASEIERASTEQELEQIQSQLEALAERAKAKVFEVMKGSSDFSEGYLVVVLLQ